MILFIVAILNPGFYDETDLKALRSLGCGSNVLIAKDAIVIGAENISLGSNIKIDSNVTLAASTGSLTIGNYVHIGGSSHLSCSGIIELESFVTISQGVKIYSASDDYSGNSLTNPTIPEQFKVVDRRQVRISKHVIIGSNSVILPGASIGEGCAIGALSLVKGIVEPWYIYGGNPLVQIKKRSKKLLDEENLFKQSLAD